MTVVWISWWLSSSIVLQPLCPRVQDQLEKDSESGREGEDDNNDGEQPGSESDDGTMCALGCDSAWLGH